MTQFRERNPVPIAIVGIIGLVLVLFLAFNAGNLAVLGGGGPTFHADFVEASDVKTSADVRIAGIKIGHVSSIEIQGDHVRMGLQLDPGTHIGSQTRADIRIKTLLGQMYVALTPDGAQDLSPRQDIPLSRTSTPLIVTAAFEGLANNVQTIDVTQLQTAFNTLSTTFKDTPSNVGKSLAGLAALSHTIASRDAQLQQLLDRSRNVTATLASRDTEITKLIYDGDTVLNLVQQQRDVIHALLINTSELSRQISALVAENTAQLQPALRNLKGTTDILTKDQKQLDQGIHLLAPFLRDFTNTLGNGRWFDTYVQNISDVGTPGCFTTTVIINGKSSAVPSSGGPGAGSCS
ncbi:MAG TPA: MCE family protein [Mycobacteriales bacterium]|jgi:phospholipid/cholesterol/gamma-HCH transport system substrate-binding protein|nr:MCE family protein [Mycobacteriales bacterium]